MWITLPVAAIAISLTAIGAVAQTATVATGEAASHVGQTATVVGAVAEVHITGKGTELLDFDARYPAQDFTAVVFASDTGTVGDVNHFWGKRVAVTGKIELYKGRPEIIVRRADQFRILP